MGKKHVAIYTSHWHLLITFFIVVLPFVFFLAFSQFAHITIRQLFFNLFISSFRLLLAYLIAVVVAWVLAIFFYRGKAAMIALPFFDVMQSFPTFAALPLATILWGPSNTTIVFFLVITVIWPILFSLISSLKLIRRDWEEAAEIAQLRGFNYLRYVVWPASIPGLVTGSIIGLGEGWEALVATEIISGNKLGLGSFFNAYSQNTMITAFGILGLLILIFSINKLIWLPLLEWSHSITEE